MTSDKLPPHAPEAEEGILSCCLQDPELIGDVSQDLADAEAFFDLRYRLIWECLQRLYTEGKKPDTILLAETLRAAGQLDQVGGIAQVAQIADAAAGPSFIENYLPLVRDRWLMRRTIQACQQTVIELMGDTGTKTVDTLLANAELRVQKATEIRVKESEKTMMEVVADVSENVLEKFRRGHKYRIGPSIGFNYLDNIMPGLVPGQLIVLAARPRMGKSALMMQIVEHLALNQKLPVAVFSLEMSARSLGLREIFQRAPADITKFLNGYLVESDITNITRAAAKLSGAPIIIDDSGLMSIEDLEVRARRVKRKHKVALIVVDYFQLLFARNARAMWSKSDELASISKRLKALAKELELPIIVCAQMNRQIEQEANRRPRLADLKDTGQLEQDADVIMFLWKPTMKHDDDKTRKKVDEILKRLPISEDWKHWERHTNERGEDFKQWWYYVGILNCTVEKQREGRSGEDALMAFIKPWTRFLDAYNPAEAKKEQAELTDQNAGTNAEEPA